MDTTDQNFTSLRFVKELFHHFSMGIKPGLVVPLARQQYVLPIRFVKIRPQIVGMLSKEVVLAICGGC